MGRYLLVVLTGHVLAYLYLPGTLITALSFGGMTYLIWVLHKQGQERVSLMDMAYRDSLTGLFNRAYVELWWHAQGAVGQMPISLVYGDVNRLKQVNDNLGHQQGDCLLKLVADAIRASCRQQDILARWGGDEFVLILPRTNSQGAALVCERIG